MINVENNTSIEDIDQNWFQEGKEIIFCVKGDSSFEIFAEPYAIATLRQLSIEQKQIKLVIPDTDSLSKFTFDEGSAAEHPIISIFGLQLIYVSCFVAFKSKPETDIRSELGKAIWQYLLDSNMSLGVLKKIQYVSNHVHPVPKAFGKERALERYTDYQSFKAEVLHKLTSSWSHNDGLSEYHLDKIAGVAFHAAENAYDHAQKHNGKKIRGYYGLTLEKQIYQNLESIKERRSTPVLLKNYLTENFGRLNLGSSGAMKVQIITVADIGDSIQRTLSLGSEMDDVDIVQAAFKDLSTSKTNRVYDENPGFGLGDIVSLARELKSLLYLQSGEFEFYQDFSDCPNQMTEEQKRSVDLTLFSERKKNIGTCFSLVWILQKDQSQPSLFGHRV